MISALIFVALASQDVRYTNPKLDLEFTHPSVWKIVEEKNASKFTIPIETRTAVLEIFDVDFRADSETWMNVEKSMAEQLRRSVQRQWQEELLGVPLLLTKTTITEDELATSTLSGLLYSATPRKMRFRLTAPADAYDVAEKAWRDVLLTLRTTSGKLPTGESPDRNPEIIPTVKPPSSFRPAKVKPSNQVKRKGEVSLPVTIEGKSLVLRVPTAWVVSRNEDGSFNLSNPLVSGKVSLSVLSLANYPVPGRALIRESSKSLERFAKVVKRGEKGPVDSAADAKVAWIRREGTTTAGELFTCVAIGLSGDYFWLFSYESENRAAQAKEQALLDEFVNVTCIEVAP